MGGSPGELSEELVTRKNGWRMNCDVGEATEWALLILQPFRHFTYVTTLSPTLPSLYLRHSSFSNPSVALPTSQSFSNPSFASPTSHALHLIHLASRPWKEPLWRASIPGIYRIPKNYKLEARGIHEVSLPLSPHLVDHLLREPTACKGE